MVQEPLGLVPLYVFVLLIVISNGYLLSHQFFFIMLHMITMLYALGFTLSQVSNIRTQELHTS